MGGIKVEGNHRRRPNQRPLHAPRLFSFTPTFKLMIAGNHKPRLRSVDEAIRRRFHLIHFAVTILPEQRDKDLAEKLKSEWPAILMDD